MWTVSSACRCSCYLSELLECEGLLHIWPPLHHWASGPVCSVSRWKWTAPLYLFNVILIEQTNSQENKEVGESGCHIRRCHFAPLTLSLMRNAVEESVFEVQVFQHQEVFKAFSRKLKNIIWWIATVLSLNISLLLMALLWLHLVHLCWFFLCYGDVKLSVCSRETKTDSLFASECMLQLELQ